MTPSGTTGASVPVQNETATNKINYFTASFVNGSLTYMEFGIPMPSDYNGGTVTCSFYWTTTSATANNVEWGIEGLSYADNTLLDTAYGTRVTVVDTNNGANRVNISAATGAVTLAGTPAASNFAQFRISRSSGGNDNLAAVALLMGVRITYTRA